MAKLPSTIYKEIMKKQRELYKDGMTNGSLHLGDVYAVFFECGYKQSTANKWLLNWAVCRLLKFEKYDTGYRVRLGDYRDCSVDDLIPKGLWLPTKEVWIKSDDGTKVTAGVL